MRGFYRVAHAGADLTAALRARAHRAHSARVRRGDGPRPGDPAQLENGHEFRSLRSERGWGGDRRAGALVAYAYLCDIAALTCSSGISGTKREQVVCGARTRACSVDNHVDFMSLFN